MRRTVTAAVAGVALAALIGAGVAAATDGTGPAGRLGEVLSGLVNKGTITQQQADEVAEALTDAHADAWAERDEARAQREAEIDDLLQNTLDKDLAGVRAELAQGRTLLEVAGDDADDLAAGMLDLLGQRLDQAVDEGRLTDDQAAAALDRANERAKAWLAGETTGRGGGLGLLLGGMGPQGHGGDLGPGFGMGRGGGHGHGPQGWRGPGMQGEGAAPASGTSASTISWPI